MLAVVLTDAELWDLLVEHPEPGVDEVQPRLRSRGEAHMESWVFLEAMLYIYGATAIHHAASFIIIAMSISQTTRVEQLL